MAAKSHRILRNRTVARSERFELPTLGFEVRCSIQLSYERLNNINGLARAVWVLTLFCLSLREFQTVEYQGLFSAATCLSHNGGASHCVYSGRRASRPKFDHLTSTGPHWMRVNHRRLSASMNVSYWGMSRHDADELPLPLLTRSGHVRALQPPFLVRRQGRKLLMKLSGFSAKQPQSLWDICNTRKELPLKPSCSLLTNGVSRKWVLGFFTVFQTWGGT